MARVKCHTSHELNLMTVWVNLIKEHMLESNFELYSVELVGQWFFKVKSK